jgi:2',3'-cyclic-nucleotide 2'-phosphodiesterase
MRILYVAEIVGKPGLHCVKTTLATMRKERGIDLVIANGDSVTGGFGLGKNHSIQLRKLGVDVITGGDQLFFKKDMTEHIPGAHYLLRPANLPQDMPGRGWRHYSVRPTEWGDLPVDPPADPPVDSGVDNNGEGAAPPDSSPAAQPATPTPAPAPPTVPSLQVAVISLIGQSGFDRIHGNNPYGLLTSLIDRLKRDAVAIIVDFHALTTAEKYTMFHYADGMVTAVIGSGQRVQTADAQVMPSGTAVICDAGRTGSQNSVGGFAPDPEIRKYLTRVSVKSDETWGDLQLQGVLLDIDPGTGYVTGFEALRVPCSAPSGAGKTAANAATAATAVNAANGDGG